MKKAILYIHGKDGTSQEAEHYTPLFPEYDVFGLDYKTNTPWETKPEIEKEFDRLKAKYDSIIIIGNSIGAYFAMNALHGKEIEKAFFISPIVNMEKLITDMMKWAGVTEQKLQKEKVIETSFGETLSWEYLCYVRENPIQWNAPTHILYGEKDNLTQYQTVLQFAESTNSSLTVMENGEHWFHTENQMAFLDDWIRNTSNEQ